jgi:hypothetical protein
MPYRLLLYKVEIWRNVLKETDKKEASRKDFRLPVIIIETLYDIKQALEVCFIFFALILFESY